MDVSVSHRGLLVQCLACVDLLWLVANRAATWSTVHLLHLCLDAGGFVVV